VVQMRPLSKCKYTFLALPALTISAFAAATGPRLVCLIPFSRRTVAAFNNLRVP
jgi:hypothetical protein